MNKFKSEADIKRDCCPDHLYYNIRLTNKLDTKLLVNYQETRLQPIINDNLSNYEVAVARFRFPNNLPIFIFQNNTYSVTLTGTDGIDHTVFCQWINNGSSPDQNVLQYSEWSKSVTNALNTAWLAIDAKIRPTAPPFILYDPNDLTYSLFATNEYNSVGGDNTKTQIWMNNPCFSKFEAWEAFFGTLGTAKYANILIISNGTNLIVAGPTTKLNTSPAVAAISYYEMEQEFKCLFLLSDFDVLLLRCNTLPIVSEQNSGSQSGTSQQVSSQDQFINIMTDFIPTIDINFNDRSYFEYNPTVWRWTSMTQNCSLRDIDLLLYWRDIGGTIRPIYLTYGQIATVKLAFRKKTHVI